MKLMIDKIKYFSIIALFVFVLSACSVSESDAIAQSNKIAEETFIGVETNDADQKTNSFSYYLPSGFKVESESENNLLISKGKQTFILFVNPLEASDSKVVYESTVANNESKVLEKTFEDKGRFGFLYVRSLEKDLYEVSVGVGGVKMTTHTDTKNMVESVQSMMQVVESVKY